MGKLKFTQFEILHENSSGTLVSGFSIAVTKHITGGLNVDTNVKCTTNNCHSGNCTTGCGAGSNGSSCQ